MKTNYRNIAVGMGIMVIILFLASACGGSASREPSNTDACIMSQLFVERRIKSPSTAEFPLCRKPETVITQEAGTWFVLSYVDAENGFGGTVRADYLASMTYNSSKDTWTLVDMSISER